MIVLWIILGVAALLVSCLFLVGRESNPTESYSLLRYQKEPCLHCRSKHRNPGTLCDDCSDKSMAKMDAAGCIRCGAPRNRKYGTVCGDCLRKTEADRRAKESPPVITTVPPTSSVNLRRFRAIEEEKGTS